MIKIIKQIVNKDDLYLFSLSMGVDSVAAFIWMINKGYNVIPIHFNHKLRPQNDLMEKKYRELCSALGCGWRFASTRKNKDLFDQIQAYLLTQLSENFKAKTESECREERLNFYQEVCNRARRIFYGNKTPKIITAHHLNDYVESYLLNCFRGHPTHTPIELESTFTPRDSENTEFKIIHPFLLTKKFDFRQFLERNNYMKYVVEDETNKTIKGSRRNWIRNTILPEMKKNKLSLEKFAKRKIEDNLKLNSFVLN